MAKRIFLIDHHPKLRELLTILLVSEGYDVQTCRCVENASATSADGRPCDAILVNVATPEGNWKFDYSGWLCLQPYLATGVPVVAYSLATESEIGAIKDRLALLGFPLLGHPIDLIQISAAIQRAFSARPLPSMRGLALVAT